MVELILILGTAKRSFRILMAYFTKVRRNTPGHVHRPICTRAQFNAERARLLWPLELDRYKHTLNPPNVGVSWPHAPWVKYLKSRPALYIAIDFSFELRLKVKGGALPVAGGSQCHLSIGLANHGEKAHTLAFIWCTNIAFATDAEMPQLGILWAKNINICLAAPLYHAHLPLMFASSSLF